jgi:hypothetical protein
MCYVCVGWTSDRLRCSLFIYRERPGVCMYYGGVEAAPDP